MGASHCEVKTLNVLSGVSPTPSASRAATDAPSSWRVLGLQLLPEAEPPICTCEAGNTKTKAFEDGPRLLFA
eukprot:6475097-Amphidinium_carterae.1